jgi:hypothetical protein
VDADLWKAAPAFVSTRLGCAPIRRSLCFLAITVGAALSIRSALVLVEEGRPALFKDFFSAAANSSGPRIDISRGSQLGDDRYLPDEARRFSPIVRCVASKLNMEARRQWQSHQPDWPMHFLAFQSETPQQVNEARVAS